MCQKNTGFWRSLTSCVVKRCVCAGESAYCIQETFVVSSRADGGFVIPSAGYFFAYMFGDSSAASSGMMHDVKRLSLTFV